MFKNTFDLTFLIFRVSWVTKARNCFERVVSGQPFVTDILIPKLTSQLRQRLI